MAFVTPKDRVMETSISNSQTVFALAGAVDASFNRFSASMSVGDTTIGAVVEPGVAFKSGKLAYSATNEITVDSTGFESKGTFSSGGTKEVFMGIPAALGGKVSAHGADVVAAATLDLESATGEFLTVTGGATISAITLGDGHKRTVYFSGSPLLVHSGSLVLFGGSNIQVQAGSTATFVGYGAAVLMTAHTPASRVGAANAAGAVAYSAPQSLALTEQEQACSNANAAGGFAFQVTRNNSNQTVAAATFTKVQHTTPFVDTASCWDATNYRFKPTQAGWYWLVATHAGPGLAGDSAQSAIYKNGVAEIYGIYVPAANTGDGYSTATGFVYLNGVTDYVEHWAYTPGTVIRGANTQTRFSGFRGCN